MPDLVCGPYGPFLKSDYGLIMAIGEDAANRAMRKRCARAWSDDDYNLCCEKVDLWSKHAAAVFAETGNSAFMTAYEVSAAKRERAKRSAA